MSLSSKIGAPIVVAVFIGIAISVLVTGYTMKLIVIQEVEKSTLETTRDTVLNSLTTMMVSNDIQNSKKLFIDQMKNIVDLKVIRSDKLNEQFGTVEKSYTKDDIQAEVLSKGVEKIVLEGESIRGVYPYIAKRNIMGRNCLSCHNVPEGTVLAAVDITVPLGASYARIKKLQWLFVLLGLAGILTLLFIVRYIMKVMLRPLHEVISKIKEVSTGDLTVHFPYHNNDEIGVLSRNMETMTQSISLLITRILTTSSKVVDSVDALQQSGDRLFTSAKNQAVQAQHIASASEEMSLTIGDIAKNSSVAASITSNAMNMANGGKSVAEGAVQIITNVDACSAELQHLINDLNESAMDIGNIVTIINGIADQTNLLALNASVEAAHAGDKGRGFAVVADEVRKLAEKTINATIEISSKTKAVQQKTNQATISMESSSKEVSKATTHMKSVGEQLHHIVDAVQKAKDEIISIATAVEEQSSVAENVTKNIAITSNTAQSMEDLANNISHQVNALTKVVTEMREYSSEFKTA